MLTAQRDGDPARLRFTRKERMLLGLFVAKPGVLLARESLVQVLVAADTDASPRMVDVLVTGLRAKLGDSAREPRFIATQYGEGYVWIAKPDRIVALDAFLVMGPVFGLGEEGSAQRQALAMLLESLNQALDMPAQPDRRVACAPDWRPDAGQPYTARYTLEVSWHRQEAALHTALVLRHGPSGQMLQAFRVTFDAASEADAISDLASSIKQAVWAHLAMPGPSTFAPTGTPLEIRLHDAAVMLARTPDSWRESAAQIERARAAAPDDPALAVMHGLALLARVIQQTDAASRLTPAEWIAIEDEIEALALGCLPAVQDNPLLVLGVAKLLFFIDRGHFELAERLADEAFARSTAFAAAFATQGQIRMCAGRLNDAVALYDQGIELSEPGSEFHVYLLLLKCTALLAAQDRPALAATCAALYTVKPVTRLQLGLMLTPIEDGPLPPDLAAVLAVIDETQAQALAIYLYQVSARHFRLPQHRANVMAVLTTHLQGRFGSVLFVTPQD